MSSVRSLRLLVLTVLLTLGASTVTIAQTETINYGELPTQPVNGVTFRGVTYTFFVGGVGSNDAVYNSPSGPDPAAFLQLPVLEGDAAGELIIAFANPTASISFGVARSTFVPLAPGATVQLFDPNGILVQTTNLALAPVVATGSAEALFTYSGVPIRRIVLTFPNPGAAGRFAIDNLTYNAGALAGPGISFPGGSAVSDQKAGSILFFNFYTSSPANPGISNTRFNLTNTSEEQGAFIHLFFVEGSSCSVADRYICLTPNQTTTLLASEQDPATTGYLIAISVSPTGCPINFNYLIGDEFLKLETGEFANLGAEAIAAVAAIPAPCVPTQVNTPIMFDGVNYNRVAKVLALSNIASRADLSTTLLIVNRVGGNLATSAGSIGIMFGLLFDDQESPHSFTIPFSPCQRVGVLSDAFPRTSPRFSAVIPAGQTGWMKLWSTSEVGLLGAAIRFSTNAQSSAGAFNSGHNLHKLKLTSDGYSMPIFSPGC